MLAPADVIPGFGGLEVTTSSTSLQALTDAILFIKDYPYTSTDAYGSRIIAEGGSVGGKKLMSGAGMDGMVKKARTWLNEFF